MRAKGIDENGRMVIPKPLRAELGIKSGDDLNIYVQDGKIIIEKLTYSCVLCGSEEMTTRHRGKVFCRNCLSELKLL